MEKHLTAPWGRSGQEKLLGYDFYHFPLGAINKVAQTVILNN
jgi:hypothetical protein